MLTEMWTRSLSEAESAPGKSRSELTQRVGYRVRLQVRDMAWVGFRCILPSDLVRSPTRSPTETADTRISVSEKIRRNLSLDFRVLVGGIEVSSSSGWTFESISGLEEPSVPVDPSLP